jgi:hypothetical protein
LGQGLGGSNIQKKQTISSKIMRSVKIGSKRSILLADGSTYKNKPAEISRFEMNDLFQEAAPIRSARIR